MSKILHSDQTLGEIEDDLRAAAERIATIRKDMKTAEIKEVPVEYHMMQVRSRLWLHKFASSGEESLRESIAMRTEEISTRRAETAPPTKRKK